MQIMNKFCKQCLVEKEISSFEKGRRVCKACRQTNLPYSSMEDDNFKKCWSLENLRPLSAKENFLLGIEVNKRKRAA